MRITLYTIVFLFLANTVFAQSDSQLNSLKYIFQDDVWLYKGFVRNDTLFGSERLIYNCIRNYQYYNVIVEDTSYDCGTIILWFATSINPSDISFSSFAHLPGICLSYEIAENTYKGKYITIDSENKDIHFSILNDTHVTYTVEEGNKYFLKKTNILQKRFFK